MPLWPEDRELLGGSFRPTLTPFLADDTAASSAAMIVCPGGGYQHLADHEGEVVARWLVGLGITAFVLRYRVGCRFPAPFDDVQRAIRLVRSRAEEWAIDPQRVGIIGFSAGGHLAATAATHALDGDATAADPLERCGSRPDLAVLCYPVITLGPPGHTGSAAVLLGDDPDPELVKLLSNERHVDEQTPPAFIWHTADDQAVPVANSLMFAEALARHGRPFELHVYESGPHGLGLAEQDERVGAWTRQCAGWLAAHGWGTAGG
jgi:acetyl esterase/lipase